MLGSHQVILLNLLLAKTDLLLIHLFLKFDLQILLTNLHDILLLYSFLRFQQITIPIFPYSENFLIIHFSVTQQDFFELHVLYQTHFLTVRVDLPSSIAHPVFLLICFLQVQKSLQFLASFQNFLLEY